MTHARILLAGVLVFLAACGPRTVSPEAAYEECSERARAATGPTGEVIMGVSTDGPFAAARIGVTTDFISGRNPQLVYENCFRQLTGAGPTRPLVL